VKWISAPHRRLVAFSLGVAALLLGRALTSVANRDIGVAAQSWRTERICTDAAPGKAGCHVLRRVAPPPDAAPLIALVRGWHRMAVRDLAAQTISGFTPADIRDAYKLDATSPLRPLVAVVTPYDSPDAESDLQTYRSMFGLPPCTTSNGCFRKVNQNDGAAQLPNADAGWAIETALSIEIVSAVCPNCRILLVEANDPSISALGTGVNLAADLGATVILNNYGIEEDSAHFDSPSAETLYFKHAGIAVVAPSADSASSVRFPASSQYVTAVGGTSLFRTNSARGWNESVWGMPGSTVGTGSGCSAFFLKPAFQLDTGCPRRTLNDVAAVADPNTGVAVFDSFSGGGWGVYGGTEVAAAIVAGVYALAIPPNGVDDFPVQYPYATPDALFDVTDGAAGTCAGYLCVGQPGYDGPTGLGTPDGSAGFRPPADNFAMSIDPESSTLTVGDSTTITIGGVVLSGSDESVAVSAAPGLPAGVSATFSPASFVANADGSGATSTLTIATSALASAGTYEITIIGHGVGMTRTSTYTLTVVLPPPPTVTLDVAPLFVRPGHSATLTWSSIGALSCFASDAWTGPRATSGSLTVVQNVPGAYLYILECGNLGSTTMRGVTLTVVPPPTVVLTATPTHIHPGQKTTLDWTSTNSSSCAASGDWSGTKPLDGSRKLRPTIPGTYHYALTCKGPTGSTKKTVSVSVH
jgi:hypothetical protein